MRSAHERAPSHPAWTGLVADSIKREHLLWRLSAVLVIEIGSTALEREWRGAAWHSSQELSSANDEDCFDEDESRLEARNRQMRETEKVETMRKSVRFG